MLSSLGMYHSSQTQVYNKHHFIAFIATWFRPQADIPPDWRHNFKSILRFPLPGEESRTLGGAQKTGKGNNSSLVTADIHIGQAVPWGPDTSASWPCTLPWNLGRDWTPWCPGLYQPSHPPHPAQHPHAWGLLRCCHWRGVLIGNCSYLYHISLALRKYKVYKPTILLNKDYRGKKHIRPSEKGKEESFLLSSWVSGKTNSRSQPPAKAWSGTKLCSFLKF